MGFEYTTPAIEKWRLNEFFDIINEFEDTFANIVNHKVSLERNYQVVLVHIAGKALVTTREVLTLCAHGYPDGALALGRNLYEQMMIVSFFEIHKNDIAFQSYIDDYMLNYEVQRIRMLRSMGRYSSDSKAIELDELMKEIRARTSGKIEGDYWWADCKSFAELVDCVMREQRDTSLRDFLSTHYVRYKRACISLHAGCMGNVLRIGKTANMALVDTSATLYGQSKPLVYTAVSMISIIGFICSEFQMDNTKYLGKLNELAVLYKNMEYTDEIRTCDQ